MPSAPSLNRAELAIGAGWVGFGVFHSVFASDAMKRFIQGLLPCTTESGYRLAYNIVSLIANCVLDFKALGCGNVLWGTNPLLRVVSDVVGASALAGFIYVSRAYDMMFFLGLRSKPSKPLGFSFLHRFVRHPWYLCGLLFGWSRKMTRTLLVVQLVKTVYFFVGSYLEEQRLLSGEGGEVYREYASKVPGIIPLPWKYLSDGELKEMEERLKKGNDESRSGTVAAVTQ